MRPNDMEGFAECLLGDLPVRADDLCDMGLLVTVSEVPALEMLDDLTEEVVQGFSIRIRVDEHHSGPDPDGALREHKRLRFNMGEVPIRGHLL